MSQIVFIGNGFTNIETTRGDTCGSKTKKTTFPTMHSGHIASGLAPFLERIGTRSQDSINEGSFTEKVTRFTANLQQLSVK